MKDVTVLAAGDQKRIVVMITRYDFSKPGSRVSITLNFSGCKGPGKITTYVEDADSADKPGDLAPRSQADIKDGPVSVTIPLEKYAVALAIIDFASKK